MYLDYFGLQHPPFGLTPNTGFYQSLQPHQEANDVLQVALSEGEGFIKVSGEVGTGKTLLCRKLLVDLEQSYRFAYLPNPTLSPLQLYHAIAMELGLELAAEDNPHTLLDQLHRRLIALVSEGRPVVLLIDEAQALSDESLEAIRLLGNLETEQRKLIQIVLFGQPELDQRLAKEQLRQLRQRITFSYSLRPLNRDEVASYLQHRLHVAGYRGGAIFTARSLAVLTKASRGIPRLINVLAHKALMLCFGEGQKVISVKMIKQAISDTEDATLPPRSVLLPLSLLCGAAAVASALAMGVLR
ncbi:ExeA family protein [Aliagarivorans marinus]|uniref:ExeA family protein n=1 Tax=Aliagarivorans marinus TaxID=561965 RepID=UPI00047E7615|nr:AAA family ATPase [Aliagarivorans marinus]